MTSPKNKIGIGVLLSIVIIYCLSFQSNHNPKDLNDTSKVDSKKNFGDPEFRPFGFRAYGVKSEYHSRFITKPLASKNYIHRKPQFIKSFKPVNSSSFKSSFKVDLPKCELRIVETVPEELNNQAGIRSHRMTTFQALLNLFKETKSQFAMLNQWTIDGSGKDEYLFEEMTKAVQIRNVSMKIGFTNLVSLMIKDRLAPGYLSTIENYPGQIQFWKADTSNHHPYLQSKLFISDEYEIQMNSISFFNVFFQEALLSRKC